MNKEMQATHNKLKTIRSALLDAKVDAGRMRETWIEIQLGGKYEYIMVFADLKVSLRADGSHPTEPEKVDTTLGSIEELVAFIRDAIDEWALILHAHESAGRGQSAGAKAMRELLT